MGEDTITFIMEVPADQIDAITAEIESKNPAADSITINGLFYEWVGCEELVSDLSEAAPPGPVVIIPTLSQWGMIFATVILGILAVHRLRKKASE